MKNDFAISEQGEVLILPDGKILAHNITPEIAAILSALDPQNEPMSQRANKNARVAPASGGCEMVSKSLPARNSHALAGGRCYPNVE